MTTTTLLALLLAGPAHAEDPEFLLDAYGTRVDLPSGWSGTPGTWSSEGIDAATDSGGMFFFSWGTDFQSELDEDALKEWEDVLVAKALKRRMDEAEVVDSELREVGPRRVGVYELDVSASAGSGVMFGTVEAVDGHMFHMMVMTGKRKKRAGQRAIDDFIKQLDVRAPAAELEWGAEVSASGHTAKLPADWRPVLETEIEDYNTHVKDLGVGNTDACWTAIRPRGPEDPDVMLACPTPVWLGVVDEYSFEGAEAELRKTLFGEAPIEPAAPREVAGRTGFRYQADLGERKMALGVLPSAEGVMRIWTVTHGDDAVTALDSVLATSSLEGDHPVELGQTVSYYVSYRPFSPMVLGPAALLLLLGGGLIAGAAFAMRKKPAYDLDDEDDLSY